MKILHYFLGFPPYRTGGLTKYAYDLMCAQSDNRDEVVALWPGTMIIGGKIKFVKKKTHKKITSYEMINPLPIALDEGICDLKKYTASTDKKVFIRFLQTVNPDVIHIHTLMGLYKEFVDAAKDLNIRLIMTSHDYFGICPKVTLFYKNNVCKFYSECKNCVECNQTALSLPAIYAMQSPIYRYVKDMRVIKRARANHRLNFFDDSNIEQSNTKRNNSTLTNEDYKKLRAYYINILKQIDCFHFNSTVSESIYKQFFIPKDSKVISITHQGICDNRNQLQWIKSEKIRISYLAPINSFKGFNIIKQALDDIWSSGNTNFILNIFRPIQHISPYMKVKEDGFTTKDLPNIMSNTDILIALSSGYETFGFTVLEALSYGVPVIVSNHVGAKDIIGNGGLIVEANSVEEIKKTLLSLNRKKIQLLQEGVQHLESIKTIKTHLEEIYELYSR